VHEEDARLVVQEVIVQRRDLEPVVEGGGHRGFHLVLGKGQVAHHHRLLAGLLKSGP
jgi:hypothetical protein